MQTINLSEHSPQSEDGTKQLTVNFKTGLFVGGYINGNLNCRAIMKSFKKKISFSVEIMLNDFLVVERCPYEVEIQPDDYFMIPFNDHFFLLSYPIFADKMTIEIFPNSENDGEIEIYILETPATISLISYSLPVRIRTEEVRYDDLVEDVSMYERDVDIWRDCRDLDYEMIYREIGF